MSETSHNVRVWAIDMWAGKTKTTYWVRWRVGTKRFKEPFATYALADAFRPKLMTAAKDGTPFDCKTGRPVTMLREAASRQTWFDFACEYVDMK